LYVHQKSWPGHTPAAQWLSFFQPEVVVAIGGLKPKVKAARLLKTGEKVLFTQDDYSLRLTSLPVAAPDSPTTVIELECDGEPVVDHSSMRPHWPRFKAGTSA
jgi:alpha-L-fucosidase